MEKNKIQDQEKINGIIPSADKLEEMTHNAGRTIGSYAADLSNATSDYIKASKTYVKANPIKGVAIAATAGVVVGSLLTVAMRGSRV